MHVEIQGCVPFKSSLAQELHEELHSPGAGWAECCHQGMVPGPAPTVVQEKQWQFSSVHKWLGSEIKAKHFPRKTLQENEYSVSSLSFLGCAWLILAWSKPWVPCCTMAIALRWKTKSSKLNCFILVDLSCLQKKRFEVVAECHSELLVFLKISVLK